MILRYSATHKTEHNKVYRLDALDAYNQKLVKKIAVRGITVKGLGRHERLPVPGVDRDRDDQAARGAGGAGDSADERASSVCCECCGRTTTSTTCPMGWSSTAASWSPTSTPSTDTVSFTNGVVLGAGEATGDVNEAALRRIQIREAIKAHFEKEQALFAQGIKVLSLFFIDEVAKYRELRRGRRADGRIRPNLRGGIPRSAQRSADAGRDTPYNQYLKGIAADEDAQRLLLHRQEDQAAGRTRREDARRDRPARPTTWTPTT